MKTTNHTPGPWNLNVDSVHIREGVTVQPVAHHMDAQGIADARLISAAPEMLDALQAIVDAYGDQNSLLIDQCKAALAKAKETK